MGWYHNTIIIIGVNWGADRALPSGAGRQSPSRPAFWHVLSTHHPDPDPQWAGARTHALSFISYRS
eukprot:scaffold75239_cov33-Tisochrysis_lutea.AAC.1